MDGESGDEPGEATAAEPDELGDDLTKLVKRLQRLVDPRSAVRVAQVPVGVAWRGVTSEEPRVQVTIAVVTAIGLMLALPARVAIHPRWVLPALATLLLIAVFVARTARFERRARVLRFASLALIGFMSLANAASGARLIVDLVRAQHDWKPAELLLTGGAIWLTNVIVFGLWYWDLDRGGAAARAHGSTVRPAFVFPEMSNAELVAEGWYPTFVDYLHLSFSTAMAFSPTDVSAIRPWAKLMMMAEESLSLVVGILVIARSVNIVR